MVYVSGCPLKHISTPFPAGICNLQADGVGILQQLTGVNENCIPFVFSPPRTLFLKGAFFKDKVIILVNILWR